MLEVESCYSGGVQVLLTFNEVYLALAVCHLLLLVLHVPAISDRTDGTRGLLMTAIFDRTAGKQGSPIGGEICKTKTNKKQTKRR